MKFLDRMNLKIQLIAAMMICILTTSGVVIAANIWVQVWYESQFTNNMSAAAQKVNDQIEAYIIPTDMTAVRELLDKNREVQTAIETYSYYFVILLALTAIILGTFVAIFFAVRFTRPLQIVSESAKRVASGDFSTRAVKVPGTFGEAEQLMHNFNIMTQSLENYQRQFVENSAAIAHELRTPLMILQGRLQGMAVGMFKAEPRDIEALIVQVESLNQIVNDLRIVSLASAGKLQVQFSTTELSEELDMLIHMLEPEYSAAGFSFELDLRAVSVKGDANRLRQAALALIENARRHGTGGKIISVATGISDNQGYLRIMDRGPGLPADSIDRLFEPFWRQEGSRSRALGGSGLGLSVVSSIITAHSGTITARNRVSGGAIFEIHLPLITANPVQNV
jgi:two-component system, OmpR family, sensor histidine kinase AdeS